MKNLSSCVALLALWCIALAGCETTQTSGEKDLAVACGCAKTIPGCTCAHYTGAEAQCVCKTRQGEGKAESKEKGSADEKDQHKEKEGEKHGHEHKEKEGEKH